MSTVIDQQELEGAIAAAELDDDEARSVTAMVVEGAGTIEEAVAAALAARTATVTPPAAKTVDPAGDEPTPRQLKELEKENTRHVEAVIDLMGAFVDGFVPCSTCDTMGLEPPQPPAKTHDFFRACATCNGYGQVLTGSLEQQFASIACPDCGGRGYLEMLVDNTPAVELIKQLRAQRATAQVLDPAQPPPAPAPAPALDVGFGRPAWMGDPTVGQ
jgi:hypothetical protein